MYKLHEIHKTVHSKKKICITGYFSHYTDATQSSKVGSAEILRSMNPMGHADSRSVGNGSRFKSG